MLGLRPLVLPVVTISCSMTSCIGAAWLLVEHHFFHHSVDDTVGKMIEADYGI